MEWRYRRLLVLSLLCSSQFQPALIKSGFVLWMRAPSWWHLAAMSRIVTSAG